jgi:hypothetical protein
MPDIPDKTPAKKSPDADDAWPNTMRHYKWEKKEPEADEPVPDNGPTPAPPRRGQTGHTE